MKRSRHLLALIIAFILLMLAVLWWQASWREAGKVIDPYFQSFDQTMTASNLTITAVMK